MFKEIDRILSHIETLLRYAAPGFVAIMFVRIAGLTFNPFQCISEGLYPWAITVAAVLLGVALYGVNNSVLVPLFWGRAIVWLCRRCCRWVPENLKKERVSDLIYMLVIRRWVRRASEKQDAKCIQEQLDRWSTLLQYLYCSSYPAMVVALWLFLQEYKCTFKFWIILVIGIVLLISAWISDYRITSYEFRIWSEYPVIAKNERQDKEARGKESGK